MDSQPPLLYMNIVPTARHMHWAPCVTVLSSRLQPCMVANIPGTMCACPEESPAERADLVFSAKATEIIMDADMGVNGRDAWAYGLAQQCLIAAS